MWEGSYLLARVSGLPKPGFYVCVLLGLRSADGMIRLYRNYDPSLCNGPVQMVSAFRGLNEVLQVKGGTGVITDWKQTGGILFVGGDSRIVRVWDAHTESQLMVCFLSPVSNPRSVSLPHPATNSPGSLHEC